MKKIPTSRAKQVGALLRNMPTGASDPEYATLQDDIYSVYGRRALGAKEALPGDWPELYALACRLERRVDVYFPALDGGASGRCIVNGKAHLPRWCLLRDGAAWSPLLGDVPDSDVLSAEVAEQVTTGTLCGDDALYEALCTLSLLGAQDKHGDWTVSTLRDETSRLLFAQAAVPYGQRDAVLMQMLAML